MHAHVAGIAFILVLVATTVEAPRATGGALLFSDPRGMVFINGQSTLGNVLTVEARVLFTSQFASFGMLFNEWQLGVEDKQIRLGPAGQRSYFYGLTNGNFETNRQLTAGAWHHVAWTSDGGQESWFIDGQRIASRALSGGDVRDSPQGVPRLGAITRDGGLQPAMVGYIDWFRITQAPLYANDVFLPPGGAAGHLSGGLILYNFDATNGNAFNNESGASFVGTLGSFSQIVANPAAATLGDLTGDSAVATDDFSALTLAISDPAAFSNQFPLVDAGVAGDLNGDQRLDGGDRRLLAQWLDLALPGDFNGDKIVDGADFLVWQRTFGSDELQADADGNGEVDGADLDVWRLHFDASNSAAVVPEPADMGVAWASGALFCGLFRRRTGDR